MANRYLFFCFYFFPETPARDKGKTKGSFIAVFFSRCAVGFGVGRGSEPRFIDIKGCPVGYRRSGGPTVTVFVASLLLNKLQRQLKRI